MTDETPGAEELAHSPREIMMRAVSGPTRMRAIAEGYAVIVQEIERELAASGWTIVTLTRLAEVERQRDASDDVIEYMMHERETGGIWDWSHPIFKKLDAARERHRARQPDISPEPPEIPASFFEPKEQGE